MPRCCVIVLIELFVDNIRLHESISFLSSVLCHTYRYNKDMRQIVYMLCGLPGSGKSTYAQRFVDKGLPKLSPDEEAYARYGRAGVDYPKHEYAERYQEILVELEQKML